MNESLIDNTCNIQQQSIAYRDFFNAMPYRYAVSYVVVWCIIDWKHMWRTSSIYSASCIASRLMFDNRSMMYSRQRRSSKAYTFEDMHYMISRCAVIYNMIIAGKGYNRNVFLFPLTAGVTAFVTYTQCVHYIEWIVSMHRPSAYTGCTVIDWSITRRMLLYYW